MVVSLTHYHFLFDDYLVDLNKAFFNDVDRYVQYLTRKYYVIIIMLF